MDSGPDVGPRASALPKLAFWGLATFGSLGVPGAGLVMYQTNPAGAITELRVELVKQLDSVDDKVDGLDQKLDTALAEQSVNRIRIKALEDASARTDHKLERLEDRLTDLGDQIHKSGERKK